MNKWLYFNPMCSDLLVFRPSQSEDVSVTLQAWLQLRLVFLLLRPVSLQRSRAANLFATLWKDLPVPDDGSGDVVSSDTIHEFLVSCNEQSTNNN